jgi:hypothetical protein
VAGKGGGGLISLLCFKILLKIQIRPYLLLLNGLEAGFVYISIL